MLLRCYPVAQKGPQPAANVVPPIKLVPSVTTSKQILLAVCTHYCQQTTVCWNQCATTAIMTVPQSELEQYNQRNNDRTDPVQRSPDTATISLSNNFRIRLSNVQEIMLLLVVQKNVFVVNISSQSLYNLTTECRLSQRDLSLSWYYTLSIDQSLLRETRQADRTLSFLEWDL